jgi:hypothetical protein
MLGDTTSRYFARRQEMSIRRIVSELLVIRPQFAKTANAAACREMEISVPTGTFATA